MTSRSFPLCFLAGFLVLQHNPIDNRGQDLAQLGDAQLYLGWTMDGKGSVEDVEQKSLEATKIPLKQLPKQSSPWFELPRRHRWGIFLAAFQVEISNLTPK